MAPELWSTTHVFVILGHFFPFYPTNNLKNCNVEKMKKAKCLNMSFYTCVTQMTNIWFLIYEAQQIFFSFWTIFFPLTPLTLRKIKILKQKKILGNITILYMCTINKSLVMHGSCG